MLRFVRAGLLALFALTASSCAPPAPYVWVSAMPPQVAPREATALQPGDTLSILVAGQKDLSGQFPVGDDGAITLPLAGRLVVQRLTPQQAANVIARGLSGKIVDPKVSVAVLTRSIRVSVIGEVRSPGIYDVKSDTNVLQVLARAGGMTEFADDESIFVVAGRLPTRVRMRYDDMTRGDARTLSFAIRDGDVIVVE